MNTKTLARHYGPLTPRERFPLIVAAQSRGDEVEMQRLIDAAPRIGLSAANHTGTAAAVLALAKLHLIQQLDVAVAVWCLDRTVAVNDLLPKPERRSEFQLLLDLRLAAYQYLIEADAWRQFCRQFCAELNLDPEALLFFAPVGCTLRITEELARLWTVSPEKAAEGARLRYGPDARPPTVEKVLADYRAGLEFWERRWNPS
jgi:hypothetical protein